MSLFIDIYEAERQFADFAASRGFPLPKKGFRLDGKIHRFDIDGKKDVGAYQFWPDGKGHDGWPHGWIQDHRNAGDKEHWQFPREGVEQSAIQTARARANSPEARGKREAEEEADAKRRREGLQLARSDYEAASPVNEAPDHPYLEAKHVPAVGPIRCGVAHISGKEYKDTLLIPCHDIESGELVALHRVFSWRDKSGKFPKGWYSGTSDGAYTVADNINNGPVIVCEGISTALSLYEATEYLTIASMDAGNLAKIAPAVRAKYPDRKIFVGCDDDKAGKDAAQKAMEAGFNGVLLPPFLPDDEKPPRWNGDKPPNDWNDYVVMHGADVAGKVIEGLIDHIKATAAPETDYLQSVSGSDFWTIDIPQTKWIVPGVIKTGLSVLAGAQKMGKSTIVTDLAFAVATGSPFLGHFEVDSGDVLYLNYEDDLHDLRERARALGYSDAEGGFHHLQLEFDAPRQDAGGMDLISRWAASHPNRRLLIIDPFVKFRRHKRVDEKGLDAYQLDYAVVGEIHSLGLRYGISILVVHHDNKTPGGDWVLRANGSVALTASANTIIRLDRKRGQFDAKLTVTGRGIKERDYALKGTGLRWEYQGDAEEYERSQNITSIMDYLKENGESTIKDIAESLEISMGTVKTTLYRNKSDCFYQSLDRKRWGARTPL